MTWRCRNQLHGQVPQGRFLEVHVAEDFENSTWAVFIDFLYLGKDAKVATCDVEELLRCAAANQYQKLQVLLVFAVRQAIGPAPMRLQHLILNLF